ncbi:LacI family DNA-binding transcriptional regulator [Teichococcus vastitatis]|uniref:LacI family DNA-binding transcriptional regulator n=1 Tax=Teichococcus vastitatis TaxID=2307076 RepID=A0ABS9WAC8_9PROT|nr:LacI family DNA-binding transcriptional regulator [Pseudoroseomonas vastitatis]MCI0756260.1 LacI family DNA-binding transcriptional regulator [Pseudoroseomonas vastitatis]
MTTRRDTGSPNSVPTIRDVARAAGVSIGTVSRVINATVNVSPTLRDRVEAAIGQLGFIPDTAASSLRGRSTRSFACVVRDLTVPVLAQFADAMQRELDAKGCGLFVASSYHAFARERDLLRTFEQRRVDGLVIATSSERSPHLLSLLRRSRVPIALLDRSAPAGFDAVLVDHASGAQAAVEHLLEIGHRQIAFISGEASLRPTRERLRGFETAHHLHGIEPNPQFSRFGNFATDYGFSAAIDILAQRDRPTALFAAGTALLPGVLRAARHLGLRIPRDLSIVAGADSELAEFHAPSISVVRWDHGELGASAARFLLRRVSAPELLPQNAEARTTFLARESCVSPRS